MKKESLSRVIAIHDICGYGKCSLAIALPIISACGSEVCPLPTAVLSTNTNFTGFKCVDFTDHIEEFKSHWKQIGLTADSVYSGFLGSAKQISLIEEIVAQWKPENVIIDPVMGDNGIVYKTYNQEMCSNMKRLAGIADVVIPNLTEACILAEENYDTVDQSEQGMKRLAEKIKQLGAKSVVITGIERKDKLFNCVLEGNCYIEREVKLLPFRMHGTGDLFASVVVGGILSGHSLIESVDSAAKFVIEVMNYSKEIPDFMERGACFEPFLYKLKGGIYHS